MQNTLKASQQGQAKIKEAREAKGWTIDSHRWLEEASKVLEPNWQVGDYLPEGISFGTWSRFLGAKHRINAPAFKAYCQVLELNWEEIVDTHPTEISEPNQTSDFTYFLVFSGTLKKEVDRQRAEAIVAHLQQLVEDPFLTLQRIKPGSVVLVLKGSQEGFEVIEALFNSGQLTEILGLHLEEVGVESTITAPVNLSQWLQNNFVETLEVGWRTIKEIFGGRQPAFRSWRSSAVEQTKLIDLGTDGVVALVVGLTPEADGEIDIRLGVYPTGSRTELPENLKLIVLDAGEPVEEVTARSGDDGIVQPLSGSPGDEFSVRLVIGDVSITENFVI